MKIRLIVTIDYEPELSHYNGETDPKEIAKVDLEQLEDGDLSIQDFKYDDVRFDYTVLEA